MSALFSAARLAAVLLVLCVALLGAVGAAGTADAAHDRNGEPVDGVQQAYNPAEPGRTAPAEVVPGFFFHGAKPNPTFNTQAPAGSEPRTQQTDSILPDEDVPGDQAAVFWEGNYTGTLDGALHFRWFWSSANVIGSVVRVDATVTVFSDADSASGEPQPDKIIGREEISLSVGALPQENISTVSVDGAANDKLLIQVVPKFFDSGTGLTTTYDSDDFPGSFQVLGAGEAPNAPQTTPAEYNGEPFRVQAVNIGRDAAEPTIGVNKDGTAFYAAGAFDALPQGSPLQLARTKVLRSRDGGLTWKSVQPTALTEETTIPPTTLDPYVYVEEESGRVFNPELYLACSYLQYSDDEGESYQTNEAACGEFVNDHQTVFAGPPPANLEGQLEDEKFPEVLYYCFNRVVDSNCGRSLDGGRTFDPALGDDGLGVAFRGFDPEAGGLCGGLHGHIATDSEGRLFLPKGHCGFPWIGISEDGAETWQRVQISDKISAAGPHLSVAVDAADNVYFAWWDAADHLPYLSRSTDHGKTWSKPMMIAPPGVREVNFPVIHAGAEGRIAINFPGTTVDNQDDHTRPWNQYIVASTNALDAEPLFVSTTANETSLVDGQVVSDDPIHRGDCLGRCGGMFDFLDVIVSPHDGDIWATATDTCTNDDEEGEPSNEDVDCVNNPKNLDGNGGKSPNVSNDEEGYAIRQLSGPDLGLPPGVEPPDADATDPGGDEAVGDAGDERSGGGDTDGGDTDGGATLPATGGGVGLILIGAVMMPAALLIRRRRD